MRAGPGFSGFPRTRLRIRFDALCAHVVLLDVPLLVLAGHICVISVQLGMQSSWPMVIPINRFAAGPVRDATRHSIFSPDVQHWWRAMASNCMSQGRNCADTVPSNIGNLGLNE